MSVSARCFYFLIKYLISGWNRVIQRCVFYVARRLSALVLHLSAKNPTFERKKNPRLSAFYLSYLLEKKN